MAVPARPQGEPLPLRLERPRELPPEGSLVDVEGEVVVTAVKRAEDSERLLVRVLNQGAVAQRVSVRPRRSWSAVQLVDLREEAVEDLAQPELELEPWRLATFAFSF